jgi:hypothetical protein
MPEGKKVMEIDLSLPRVREALIEFTHAGAKSHCPFCKGRMIASVSPGQRIMILQGTRAGQCATISKQPGWSEDEFLVHFDFEESDTLTRVHYRRDKFALIPLDKIPDWLSSLSIDDLSALEESSLYTVLHFASARRNQKWADLLLPLVATVRARRLPVQGVDIWRTLVAHGFSERHKSNFFKFFDFGVELLVLLHGRPAIRRKKMRAMSRGRYLTPGREEYFGPSPYFTS